MIAVTFNANPAFLLDDVIDWKSDPVLTAEIPGAVESGLSAIETRRATGDTLRLSLSFSATLEGTEAVTNLRNSLQSLNTQPVLCPLWPALFEAGATPPITAPWYVAIGDGEAPTIYAASALPLTRQACPLMIGRLTNPPDPELISDESESVDYDFAENDSTSLTPPAFAPSNGPAAANGARPLWPFRPNWDESPHTGGAYVDIDRETIGQGRVTADAYYDQLPRRLAAQSFTLTDGDPWNLLSLFAALTGVGGNFWLPASMVEASLTANVLSTDTTLTVDNPTNIGTNAYILIDDSTNRVCVKVTGTTGSKWNLSGAAGTAFASDGTRLETLMLARLDATKISLKFMSPLIASVELKFREVPYEVTGGSAETIAETFGPMPKVAYLYVFSIAYPQSGTVSPTAAPGDSPWNVLSFTGNWPSAWPTTVYWGYVGTGNPSSPGTVNFYSDTAGTILLASATIPEAEGMVNIVNTSSAVIGSIFIDGPFNTVTNVACSGSNAITFSGASSGLSYFTDFERNLTDGSGNTYTGLGAWISNDEITETDKLDRQTVKIQTRNFISNPLALLVPFALEFPLNIQIYEADVSGDTAENLRCLFSGEIADDVEFDGPYISATAKSMSHIFDNQIPRRLYQGNCNWVLFEPGCGLLRSNWTWTGKVTSYNALTGELVLNTVVSTSSNTATLSASFFAGGYCSIGTGSGIQYRMLAGSDAEAAGDINLYLSNAFTAAPAVGDTVTFLPGCDGQYANTCIPKFANGANFGGMPFIPAADPTFMQTHSASGGKK